MDKNLVINIGEKKLNLEFNQASGYKLAQYLGVKDATVKNLASGMNEMLQKDGLKGVKFLVSAGVYGYDFVHSDSVESNLSPSEIGRLLLEMDDTEATKLIDSFYENLGLNLKAETVKEPSKKKVARKKKS